MMLMECKKSEVSTKFKRFMCKIAEQLRKYKTVSISDTGELIEFEKSNKWKTFKLKEAKTLIPFESKRFDEVIKTKKKINLFEYHMKSVIYFCITSIGLGYIICKIGYSTDIVTRLKDLASEYECEIYLMDIYCVYSCTTEKEFHKCMKKIYPELIYEYTINNAKKTELYYYHSKLMEEFETLDARKNINLQQMYQLMSVMYGTHNNSDKPMVIYNDKKDNIETV
jgi:hypothetical protein